MTPSSAVGAAQGLQVRVGLTCMRAIQARPVLAVPEHALELRVREGRGGVSPKLLRAWRPASLRSRKLDRWSGRPLPAPEAQPASSARLCVLGP